MTQEEQNILEKIRLPIYFGKGNGYIMDKTHTVLFHATTIGRQIGEMLCTALNHYYSPAPIDVEGAAEEWAKGKLGVLTGLDTAIKSRTNASVNTMLIKAFLAGHRHAGQQPGYYQKCPKCDGQGTVSKPPYVPGDVHSWSSTGAVHVCDVCNGAKVLFVQPPSPKL